MGSDAIESEKQQLKHLGFIKIAAINILIWVSNLYEYAKQNSGPLRSGVRTVEGTVTTVVAPVREKFKDVPYNLLVFLDKKVDEAANKFDKDAPPLAKQIVGQASCFAQKATKITQTLVSEARTGGVPAAISYGLGIYKEFALDQSVKVWCVLNQIPTFQKGAAMVVPTAANCSGKYNHVVMDMRQKGYSVFGYLPLVPLEKIEKTFNKKGEAVKEGAELN